MKPIKASQLVEILQAKIKTQGDLDIYLPQDPVAYEDDEKVGETCIVCVGASTLCYEEGGVEKYDRIMLLDPGTWDSFNGVDEQ